DAATALLPPNPLHDLPARDPQVPPTGGRAVKGVDERRLSHPRLAGDEDRLPLAPQRPVETSLELGHGGVTADERLASFRPARRRRRSDGRVAHGGDELIPPPGNRLDEDRSIGSIAE